MTWHERLEQLMRTIDQERDELRLKVHLASKEARDEFAAMETRLDNFRARFVDAQSDARESAGDVGDAVTETAGKLADELRAGYRRIRDSIGS